MTVALADQYPKPWPFLFSRTAYECLPQAAMGSTAALSPAAPAGREEAGRQHEDSQCHQLSELNHSCFIVVSEMTVQDKDCRIAKSLTA